MRAAFFFILFAFGAACLPTGQAGAGIFDFKYRTMDLVYDGVNRRAHVFVPRGQNGGKGLPVLLLLHGFGGSGLAFVGQTSILKDAKAQGYVVVAPDGVDSAWNAGECCGTPKQQDIDDVGYVARLLKQVSGIEGTLNKADILAYSNGAMMGYRLACERSELVQSMVVFAGTYDANAETCNLVGGPMPVAHGHGELDPLVPVEGGNSVIPVITDLTPASRVIEYFAQAGQCDKEVEFVQDGVPCTVHRGCANGAEVVMCIIPEHGHEWPGSDSKDSLSYLYDFGPVSDHPTLSATASAMEFFASSGNK